jgi:hypothetical protein
MDGMQVLGANFRRLLLKFAEKLYRCLSVKHRHPLLAPHFARPARRNVVAARLREAEPASEACAGRAKCGASRGIVRQSNLSSH